MIITSDTFIGNAKHWLTKKRHYVLLTLGTLLLSSCVTTNVNVSGGMALNKNTPVVVGPMANHTDVPLANRQVESISLGLLQARGFRNVHAWPRPQSCEKLLYCPDEGMTDARLVQWANQHKVTYVLTGAANEWRYKVGLDGEPVAGVSLALIHAATGKTVWSAVGSSIGGSRSGLDVIGQQLLTQLLKNFVAVD